MKSRQMLTSTREWLKTIHAACRDDDVFTYAGALAYHSMLALFPFLLFLVALITFLDIPNAFGYVLRWSRMVLPPEAMDQVIDVVDGFRKNKEGGLLSFGVAGAIWAASGGIRSAMNGLNRAYDVEEARPALRRYLVSLLYTLAFGTLILLAVALMFIGPTAAAWITRIFDLDSFLITLWTWVRYPLLLSLLFLFTALAYSFLPNNVEFRLITRGSFAAVAIWLCASLGLRFYVSNFSRYNVVYGSVGALIVLLLFLYISGLALLIGGEINSLATKSRASPPTSVINDPPA